MNLDRIVTSCLKIGATGFVLMFVTLAIGIPPQFAIAMIVIGVVGGLIGGGYIVIDTLRGGWRRK